MMDPRQLFVDERLRGVCVFCGSPPDTRDHIPSKVFLDEPLPEDLPVVEACTRCNQSYSLDEEYLACFLEAVLSGSVDPDKMTRSKIKHALSRNPRLVSRIGSSARIGSDGMILWTPESDRVRNVVEKLARGHVAYELSLPLLGEPIHVGYVPLLNMSDHDRKEFEKEVSGELDLSPEIGSRAFFDMFVVGQRVYSPGSWIEVQPGRYRYSVDQSDGLVVRIVISDYLACYVAWN